ncbi:hypothetical protein GIW82_00920 [Planomicrobium sp. YIM 101495]|nr:hypothetical protein [Planomicrobium sp. YIM 101495]
MTRRASRWSLDNKKSGSGCSDPTSAGVFANDGVLQPSDVKTKRLEGLAAGVWTIRKAEAAVLQKLNAN